MTTHRYRRLFTEAFHCCCQQKSMVLVFLLASAGIHYLLQALGQWLTLNPYLVLAMDVLLEQLFITTPWILLVYTTLQRSFTTPAYSQLLKRSLVLFPKLFCVGLLVMLVCFISGGFIGAIVGFLGSLLKIPKLCWVLAAGLSGGLLGGFFGLRLIFMHSIVWTNPTISLLTALKRTWQLSAGHVKYLFTAVLALFLCSVIVGISLLLLFLGPQLLIIYWLPSTAKWLLISAELGGQLCQTTGMLFSMIYWLMLYQHRITPLEQIPDLIPST